MYILVKMTDGQMLNAYSGPFLAIKRSALLYLISILVSKIRKFNVLFLIMVDSALYIVGVEGSCRSFSRPR